MPVEVSVTEVVPVASAPSATLPLAAVDLIVRFVVDDTTPLVLRVPAADKVNAPAVAVKPEELKLVVLVMVPLPKVPETPTAPPELEMVAVPVLLSTSAPAWVFRAPMAPEPPLRLTVGAMTLPADWVVVPVPVAVRVTEVPPVALAPSAMLPLAAVDLRVKLVVEETTPVVARLPAVDSVSAPAVAVSPELLIFAVLLIVPEPVVPDIATTPPALVMVVAPALFSTIVLACVLRLPTAPLPPLMFSVPATTLPPV